MNLRKAVHKSRGGGDDVNITPVLNLFLVLVPFLLLTAVFVRIAVLELTLPTLAQQKSEADRKQDKPVILVLLAISDKGFELKAPGIKFAPIPLAEDLYQFDILRKRLQSIKERYPDTEEITIQPADAVLYEVIVKVMDTCREVGFPNISISG